VGLTARDLKMAGNHSPSEARPMKKITDLESLERLNAIYNSSLMGAFIQSEMFNPEGGTPIHDAMYVSAEVSDFVQEVAHTAPVSILNRKGIIELRSNGDVFAKVGGI
tara:strand:- start:257 stop:580 length:324 start_codon:yes stop_codon:yes gene_type:complete